jgi:hypothetical protein
MYRLKARKVIQLTVNFSIEALNIRISWNDVFQVLGGKKPVNLDY